MYKNISQEQIIQTSKIQVCKIPVLFKILMFLLFIFTIFMPSKIFAYKGIKVFNKTKYDILVKVDKQKDTGDAQGWISLKKDKNKLFKTTEYGPRGVYWQIGQTIYKTPKYEHPDKLFIKRDGKIFEIHEKWAFGESSSTNKWADIVTQRTNKPAPVMAPKITEIKKPIKPEQKLPAKKVITKEEIKIIIEPEQELPAKINAPVIKEKEKPMSAIGDHFLASGSFDSSTKIWNLSDINNPKIMKNILTTYGKNKSPILAIAFNQFNHKILAIGSAAGKVYILDLSKPHGKEIIKILDDHEYAINSLAFNNFDKNFIAAGSSNGDILIWDLSKPIYEEFIKKIQVNILGVKSLAFSHADKNLIACSDAINTIKLFDISKPKNTELIKNIKVGQEYTETSRKNPEIKAVRSLSFNYIDKNILACAGDNKIIILDVSRPKNKEIIKTLSGHTDIVLSVAFSPFDKNILVSTSVDKTAKIWDISRQDGQECTHTLSGHQDRVKSAAFSDVDKNIIATGSRDKTVKIWDISKPTGLELRKTLEGYNKSASTIAFPRQVNTP